MSWKGFQKAVNRLPYQLLSKKSEGTKDPEYLGLEKNFKDITKYIESLAKDARLFRDSIASLLSSQAAMAQYLATIYDNHIGIEVPEGTVQKRFQQTSSAHLQAANDAEAAMAYCRDEVLPELDVVDRDIIRPLLELCEIIKIISKTMTKRDHKLIDYDRHRIAMQKLQGKAERSFNEEKQVFKTQSLLDVATQDYNYLNNMLKKELHEFFRLKQSFIQPVFDNLYNMQCRIYGMIYARCYELLNQNGQIFSTHTLGIEEGYQLRQTQRNAQFELEQLDLLKSGGKAWLAVSGAQNSTKLSLQDRAALKANEGPYYEKRENFPTSTYPPSSFTNPTSFNSYPSPSTVAPPAYGQGQDITLESTPISYGKVNDWQTLPVAPPTPSPSRNYVIALYDYTAQAEGDLSFKKDDKIEIIERTKDQNDWWTGRLNGKTGVFPGNYVAEL